MHEFTIHPETTIGHVHLKVADIERALGFYRDLLGFEVIDRWEDDSGAAAFLSAGGYHHHIALNTWYSAGATPPPPGHTGLFHAAILLPTRKELARMLKRLIDAEYPVDTIADHGVSEAVYLKDPDGNGMELYADRPKDQWPRRPSGTIYIPETMQKIPAEAILAELD